MTSPLVSVRSQIATDWEALTPPTDTAVTYHQVDGRAVPSGSSSRRNFWFTPPTSGVLTEMQRTLSTYRHEFTAHVRVVTSGLSVQDLFGVVVNEAVLLLNAVNERTSWTSGADYVQADGYRTERTGEDLDLVISIVAECQEAD